MKQAHLFDVADYVRKAYDELVLAYSFHDLEQLATLKSATLRTYVAIQEMAIAREIPPEQETFNLEVPF